MEGSDGRKKRKVAHSTYDVAIAMHITRNAVGAHMI